MFKKFFKLLYLFLLLFPDLISGGEKNIALNKKVYTSSPLGRRYAYRLVDGDYTTASVIARWKGNTNNHAFAGDQLSVRGEYVVIDFTEPYRITFLRLVPYDFGSHEFDLTTSFAVHYWKGGWREIMDTYRVVTTKKPVEIKIPPVITRKVRIYIYSAIRFAGFAEIEIYGEKAGREREQPEAKGWRGKLSSLLGKGDYAGSLKVIEESLKSSKGKERAILLLEKALIYQRWGNLSRTFSIFEEVEKRFKGVYPDVVRRAEEGKGDCYFLEGQFGRAKEIYLKLARIWKDKFFQDKASLSPYINFFAVRFRELRGWGPEI